MTGLCVSGSRQHRRTNCRVTAKVGWMFTLSAAACGVGGLGFTCKPTSGSVIGHRRPGGHEAWMSFASQRSSAADGYPRPYWAAGVQVLFWLTHVGSRLARRFLIRAVSSSAATPVLGSTA
jgi:hypothetical protein